MGASHLIMYSLQKYYRVDHLYFFCGPVSLVFTQPRKNFIRHFAAGFRAPAPPSFRPISLSVRHYYEDKMALSKPMMNSAEIPSIKYSVCSSLMEETN